MWEDLREGLGWLIVVTLIVFLVGLLAVQGLFVARLMGGQEGASMSAFQGEKIGVLKLDGTITSIQTKLDTLQRYRKNDSIRGLLIQVDSPGGLVGPSQELSAAVARFAETDRPVVTSVRTVGASGAYYVASSSDTIVANPGSMVGSIGVIMQFVKVEELIDKIGVDYRVIKSGDYKDLGSPFREMNPGEREILSRLIMDVYDQFLGHVLDHRSGLTRPQLEAMADGRVFTGRQALRNGLIDATGGRREAIDIIADAAGIEGEPSLVNLEGDRFRFVRAASSWLGSLTRLLRPRQTRFRLLYMMPDWGASHG